MTNIILCGCNGKMGKVITNLVSENDDCRIIAGIDINTQSDSFPVFDSFDKLNVSGDVIIDFSSPALLDPLCDYIQKTGTPAVLATTGSCC